MKDNLVHAINVGKILLVATNKVCPGLKHLERQFGIEFSKGANHV